MGFKDIFGYERASKRDETRPNSMYAKTLNTEIVMSELSRLPVHNKEPMVEWHDTIAWGSGMPGTLKLVVSPLGSLKATIRKLVVDEEGQNTWVCKKVYPLNLREGRTEQDWVGVFHDDLKKIAMEGQDGGAKNFPRLDRFMINLGGKIKQNAPLIFVFEGIRRSDEDNYIIYMSYRGQGVQRRDQRRCEQFNVSVGFCKTRGLLHIWGYDVSSPMRGHKWEVRPAEWNEYFTPSQGEKDIIESVINLVRTY